MEKSILIVSISMVTIVKHGLVLLVMVSDFIAINNTLCRGQSKMPIPSRNVDKKSLETEFLIAICRHTGDK